MPRHRVADVVLLAALGSDDRLDVLRPPPAWLEDSAPDGQLAQLDQLDASLLDTPDLVGAVEALATQLHRTDGTNRSNVGERGLAGSWVRNTFLVDPRSPCLGLGRMQQMPRLLHIGVHLLDQRLFPRVLHLPPQPGVEVDRDLDVVKLEIITI
jgi:hypothetical protein